LQEVEHYQPKEWNAPDPGKDERETKDEFTIQREPRHWLVGRGCMIMQPIGRPSDKVAALHKGSLGDVTDYNPYTDVATVHIEKNNKTAYLSTHCLFPR
jgi:hypothetical protein